MRDVKDAWRTRLVINRNGLGDTCQELQARAKRLEDALREWHDRHFRLDGCDYPEGDPPHDCGACLPCRTREALAETGAKGDG